MLPNPVPIKIFHGSSLFAPFPAAVAELSQPLPSEISTDTIRRSLQDLFPFIVGLPLTLPSELTGLPELVAALTIEWQRSGTQATLSSCISRPQNGPSHVAVEFFNSEVAMAAMRASIEIARATFSRQSATDIDISPAIHAARRVNSVMRTQKKHPSVKNNYFAVARARGIPVYDIADGSGILAYGQGAKRILMADMGTDADSYVGCAASKSKSLATKLLRQFGLPATRHLAVENGAEARQASKELGFPLVVKPDDRNGAVGVTAGIDTPEELDAAFAIAQPLARNGRVLVEVFVSGDNYRLSVFGGKLLWASRLVKPRIVGDGRRTVSELIAADNERRRKAIAAGDLLYELSIDAKMIALLAKQGSSLQDRPAAGRQLLLSDTSNLKTGGHRENVTRLIHPDNIAMAEAVARNFRLDAAGIDFITPDIGRSWLDIPCAIIEVNHSPGTSSELARDVMLRRFPPGADGRIPSIIVIGDAPRIADLAAERLRGSGLRVGQTDFAFTTLDGKRRFPIEAALPQRILGLLLDVTCDALVVHCSPKDIAEYGIPHTRFALAIVSDVAEMSKNLNQLIRENAVTCIEHSSREALSNDALHAIDLLFGRNL